MDGTDDPKARLNLSLDKIDQRRFRLWGKTVGHPQNPDGRYVYVSPPILFHEHTRTLMTASGREYKLGTFGGADEAEHLAYIFKDIQRNKRYAPTPQKAAEMNRKVQEAKIAEAKSDETVINLEIGSEVDDAFGKGGGPKA